MAPQERAKALGWLSAATSLGVLIGPVLGSAAFRAGESAPGLVAAALCVGNFIFAWKWLPESRVIGAHTRTPSGHQVPPPVPRPVLAAACDVMRHPIGPAAHPSWIYAVAILAYNTAPAAFTIYPASRYAMHATIVVWFITLFGGV